MSAQRQRSWFPAPTRKLRLCLGSFAGVLFAVTLLLHRQPMSRHIQHSTSLQVQFTEPQERKHLISPKIWQILLPHANSPADFKIDPVQLEDTKSWLALNTDYTYTLVGLEGANHFVEDHYADDETVSQTYHELLNPGLKSDLLRYLILHAEGGTYADIDTVALQPIDTWVPAALQDRVRLIVGLEFDRGDGLYWADILHDVQFCQWAIAAAPGHPVFAEMARRAVSSLAELASRHNTSLAELKPASSEVMNSTGPAAWTDVVFAELQRAAPELTDLRNLSGITEPVLYGDIMILPIDGFGMGQQHSHSTNDGSIPGSALLKHNFRGSWRDD
ncbi:family 32 glycosyltransferase [Xylariales sp. PMI_506]|nr:family 32 glycosyltransferase [Xylariales sp. PMI_506]